MRTRPFQRRHRVRPLAACAGLLLGPVGDVEPDHGGCVLPGASVRVFEGSRLFDAQDGRLTLARGRTLRCDHPAARDVLGAIEVALGEGIGGAVRERLAAPLQVHLDPRLPARHAALHGIEVHVSSRDILVERAALTALPERAWRHELLHALAPAPPPASRAGQKLWLTLEEGLVAFLTDVEAGRAMEAPFVGTDAASGHAAGAEPQLLPLLEWLESPAYDPHPLAGGLARELGNLGAEAASFLDCLTLDPARVQHGASAQTVRAPLDASLPAALSELPAELVDVFVAFGARCSAEAQGHWAAALGRWWGAPPALHGSAGPPGKAAARAFESR